MKNSLRSLTFITSSILVSAAAFAKPVTVKDWSLDDTNSVCVATTGRIIAGQTYQLQLTYDKSGQFPVEIWVRELSDAAAAKAFKITTEVAPIQSFAAIPMLDVEGKMAFWQVPTDTSTLVSYIKRQTRLMTTVLPESKVVDFSLRGSSDIIDALIKQCAGGKTLVQIDFEKSFVPVQVATLDPLKFDIEKSVQLRTLYKDAVNANNQKGLLQKQLTALNTQYSKQIRELADVTGTLDELTTKELIRLQNQKTSLEQQIASLDQQLVSQQSAITAKESEVSEANGVYDQAWRVLAPLETEHQRLASLVQSAQSDLNSYRSQLSGIEDSIQSKSAQLSDAQNQANYLSQQLNQLQGDINNARNDVDYTDNLYRRFDSYRERQDRIQWHPVARYCYENRTDRCNSLMSRVGSNADSEVSNIQSRLGENANTARGQLNDRMNSSTSLNSQLRNYTDNVIPNLQSRLSDLRDQRRSVENAVSRSSDEVANRSANLRSYDQGVGYAAKKADVTAKANAVTKLQGQLSSLEQTLKATRQTRAKAVTDLATNDKNTQNVLARIQANQGRESELNQALVPYFAEKSRIDGEIARFDSVIAQDKLDFTNLITAN